MRGILPEFKYVQRKKTSESYIAEAIRHSDKKLDDLAHTDIP